MSAAGYGMKFGKGYLGGGRPQQAPQGPDMHDHGEPDGDEGGTHEEIAQHLQSMHEKTGKAHSHVEHHGDGTHTSHHIHASGEQEGPHEHPDDESMMSKMGEMGGEPGGEQESQPGE